MKNRMTIFCFCKKTIGYPIFFLRKKCNVTFTPIFQGHRFGFCHLHACLLFVFVQFFSGYLLGQDDILKTAKSLDQVLVSGMTVICTSEKHSPGLGIMSASITKYNVRFTRSGDNIAAIHDGGSSVDPLDEKAVDAKELQLSPAVSERKVVCVDAKKAIMKDYLLAWNESSKTWVKRDANVNLFVTDTDAGIHNAWTDHLMWIAGKGVTDRFVDVIESKIETDKDGVRHFVFRAKDKDNDGRIWDIDLLPDKNCMVRKAVRMHGDSADLVITTNGHQLFDGCSFPESALVEVFLGTKVFSTNYQITNIALKFDEDIYNEAKNDIDEEMPQGALVKDESAGQQRVYINGYEDRSRPDQLPVKKKLRIYFIIGASAIILTLIIYANFFKKRNLIRE